MSVAMAEPVTASLLTALLFACSGICGQRSATALGPLRANALRLGIATILLGLMAALFAPVPFFSDAIPWLVLSGAVGFGAGDIALFAAYPHLGARLTLLINLCAAPLFGALGEWILIGTRPTFLQAVYCVVIVAGVVMALSSQIKRPRSGGAGFRVGLIATVAAGAGQGIGAVLTRLAKAKAIAAHDHFTGISEAFVRVVPGFVLSALVWWVASKLHRAQNASSPRRRWTAWVVGAAVFGPVLGVSCFQWALGQQTSAVVLSITATTPIIVIPMAIYMDGERVGAVTWIGSAIAVIGVIGVLAAG